jgi:hypothetical protein
MIETKAENLANIMNTSAKAVVFLVEKTEESKERAIIVKE